ncbi:MAG: hypothetical protein RBT80_28630 [Candidatus Vecturithrix sp.]|jgi:hypothetical protein|nr:hypothetical protein [Candidatus Vecturithrix sp.]
MPVCQHCSVELENKRAKNCPTCRSLLDEAYRKNCYSQVISAIQEAKAGGSRGEDIHTTIRTVIKAGVESNHIRQANWKALQKQRSKERSERTERFQKYGPYAPRDDEDDRVELEEYRRYVEISNEKSKGQTTIPTGFLEG